MGDFLLGSEKSTTPVETRAGTRVLSGNLLDLAGLGTGPVQGRGSPLGRLQTDARMSALGFDPSAIGVGAAATMSLADPADRTAGLFAALEPFEARERERSVAELRGGFGRLGGRFSRNAATAEGELLSGLSEGFARTREQSLLSAQDQQNQALSAILQASISSEALGIEQLQTLLQFFAPGPAQFEHGALTDIIGAGAVAAAATGGGGGS